MGQSLRLGTPTVKGGDPAAARAHPLDLGFRPPL